MKIEIITCPNCVRLISENDEVCPECMFPLKGTEKDKVVFLANQKLEENKQSNLRNAIKLGCYVLIGIGALRLVITTTVLIGSGLFESLNPIYNSKVMIGIAEPFLISSLLIILGIAALKRPKSFLTSGLVLYLIYTVIELWSASFSFVTFAVRAMVLIAIVRALYSAFKISKEPQYYEDDILHN